MKSLASYIAVVKTFQKFAPKEIGSAVKLIASVILIFAAAKNAPASMLPGSYAELFALLGAILLIALVMYVRPGEKKKGRVA